MNILVPASVLYGLLVVLLAMFVRRARGNTLDDLLTERAADHYLVHRVISNHPAGGRWWEHLKWTEEAAEK
tara:strand:- start:168 stop:380 length:213 start_codon:yes stop_codon:yes gene_type:complete